MKDLKTFLESLIHEKFVNLIGLDADTRQMREKYVDDVWNILQLSYAAIGGIKGSGFNTKQDMIDNIPFWKMYFKDNVLIYVKMYKDKAGRKSVALGTNGTPFAKEALLKDIKHELKRSWTEQSRAALVFTLKTIGTDIEQYVIPVSTVQALMPDDTIYPFLQNKDKMSKDDELTLSKVPPKLHEYLYLREIGGHLHLKMSIGTPNLHI